MGSTLLTADRFRAGLFTRGVLGEGCTCAEASSCEKTDVGPVRSFGVAFGVDGVSTTVAAVAPEHDGDDEGVGGEGEGSGDEGEGAGGEGEGARGDGKGVGGDDKGAGGNGKGPRRN